MHHDQTHIASKSVNAGEVRIGISRWIIEVCERSWRLKTIEKIEFQSLESKIQDSKIPRNSFRAILESRVRRFKKIEKIEIQSLDHGFQDCSERLPENLGSWIPEIEIQSFQSFSIS